MNTFRSRLALSLAILLPSLATAQDRNALLLPVPRTVGGAIGAELGRTQPGVSTSSPLGYGPAWRDAFIGGGYQARTRFTETDDGAVSAGIGLGNVRLLAAELVLTSLSTVRGGFGERMVGAIKIHRLLPRDFGIGVGVEGIKVRGINDSKQSYYIALSNSIRLDWRYFSGLTLNGGVGNGRFQSEDDFNADEDGLNVFASAALRIHPAISLISDWTGQDLNLAASWAPFGKIGFVITPGVADVAGTAGDGARFTLGAGLGFKF